ncbi:MAG: hypothetical protein ACK4XJ_01115 [Fimbriimonadaceae bacterium]
MIRYRPEDKPKVIVLTVGVVIAFSAVIYSLVNSARNTGTNPIKAIASGGTSEQPTVVVTLSPRDIYASQAYPPGETVRNPFRPIQPLPGANQEPTRSASTGEQTPPTVISTPRPPSEIGGNLPPAQPVFTGTDVPRIELKGTVMDRQRYAVVAVGSEVLIIRQGSRQSGLLAVQVRDGATEFRYGNERFTLKVGDVRDETRRVPVLPEILPGINPGLGNPAG